MPESSEFVLGKWVREQLEKGDDPEILKATLKNRGLDPSVVSHVVASLKKNPLPKKEPIPEKNEEPKKSYLNDSLKGEVDRILSAPLPAQIPQEEPEKDADAIEKIPKPSFFAKLKKKIPQVKAREEKIQEVKPPEENSFESSPKESILSLLKNRILEIVSQLSGKIHLPTISSNLFGRTVFMIAILFAILIVALFASYGLNWYADRMAREVLG